MTKTVFNKDGVAVRTLIDGDDYVARDGDVLRVPVTLMDSQPAGGGAAFMDSYDSRGGAPLPDAQIDARRTMWDAQKQKVSNAWKDQTAFEVPAQQVSTQAAPATNVNDSYAAYEQRMQNRWKDFA